MAHDGAVSIPLLTAAELVDVPCAWPVRQREVVHAGYIFDVVTDHIEVPDGSEIVRDAIAHGGAVAVIALDAEGHMMMVRQYRHPVGYELWEAPAGLLDVPGENAQVAAARELAEEAGMAAAEWHTLADVMTSAGMSSENIRIFLARGLSPVAAPDGFVAAGEEAHMVRGKLALAEVVAAVLSGRIHNSITALGALAAQAALAQPELLRPANAPWPARAAGAQRVQDRQ